MIDQFINFVIRPPRADYSPGDFLWKAEFTLAGRKYERKDLEATFLPYVLTVLELPLLLWQLKNGRGHILKCSHYVPSPFPENTPLPCVIYCHGNSGCRVDANEAVAILVPSNITVFTLDFSGSGISGGEFVSLGWHEKDDLKAVVSFLRTNQQISCIGLWGRSMGAVTSICKVVPQLQTVLPIFLPLQLKILSLSCQVKMAIQYMRRSIQKKAKFDIMDLNCAQVAPRTFIPALFGHATEDMFIQPHHCDHIFNLYSGDKNIIKFEGDHNSPRPQLYYDSVCIFFYNVLHPPETSSKMEKRHDLDDLKVHPGMNQHLFCDIVGNLRAMSIDATSTSSGPHCALNDFTTKSLRDLLAETVGFTNSVDAILDQNNSLAENEGNDGNDQLHFQDSTNGKNEECSLPSSSDRDSSGSTSLGVTDGKSSSESTGNSNNGNQRTLKALTTPLRRIKYRRKDPLKENKQVTSIPKKRRTEKLGSIGQRLRCCIPRRTKHKRHLSS
ncbi:Abhydrolase_5 domain-containing protein [Cinnamomum micranthum f. kanehirae]|uniref:Abhydrolase_5 domain-containing protein n=1 Tax=Cinnamomum micranthum f. kanehirae TaxID=337451 RepID=A0A3S3N827_9MAGN|nr:Abhydrolase_5 domain-containing protein [Cinnamomum micranthum f. kanehirae]